MSGRIAFLVPLALAALGLAACKGTSDQTRYRESLPAFEEVQFVEIGAYPHFDTRPLPFTPEDDEWRLKWLLQQLRSAPLSGLPSDQEETLGHVSPALSIVERGEDTPLVIVPALNCKHSFQAVNCAFDARDVVVLEGERRWRIVAPVLARWMGVSALTERPSATQAEYAAFMEREFPEPRIPARSPLRMWLSQPPSAGIVPQPWVSGARADDAVLRRVTEWLHEATPASAETVPGDAARFGDAARGLNLSFGGETGVVVSPAYVCMSDGTSLACYRSPDEVIVSDGRPWRGDYHLRAPELAQWLDSGWRDDARFGSYEEYQREARWEE